MALTAPEDRLLPALPVLGVLYDLEPAGDPPVNGTVTQVLTSILPWRVTSSRRSGAKWDADRL
ncbi:hypothetical protein Sme01_62090 [Sphaerisporangium melleum]|uniref:Uncharacterized protein n=1 Tax=Sphaerisporangium melleum TaxID=321316 RepID=A0A917RAH3_9ACTN|nr:hypothetical protein [Sphaerisporangium melleum]GGK98365.1 hypothetical protein GCM10007964_45710 [Sphaerisporangium melleum]GII73733.1 hypothetical protein Sme01_62090 [Sphaerisporangium melleum]